MDCSLYDEIIPKGYNHRIKGEYMKFSKLQKGFTNIIALSAFSLFSMAGLAAGVEGSWDANLKVSETVELPLTIHIKQEKGKWSGTLDTPTQGGFDIPMSSVESKGNELIFDISNMQIHYEGKYDKATDAINGTFIQGRPFKLDFTRQNNEKPLYAKTSSVESVIGIWSGHSKTSAGPLAFVLEVENKNGEYKVRAQSPDQSPQYIPVDTFEFNQGQVIFTIDALQIRFEGGLSQDKSIISGDLRQGPLLMKLKMDKKPVESKLSARPQTPKGPFDYPVEEVKVVNAKDNLTLAGTLTKPNGEIKATAVMISGSGAQDRDETIFRHKPFAVIADYLAKNGFAVLRLDDRGFGQSTGDFSTATTEDFARDTSAAINYLKSRKDIPSDSIGLIGHSEGGMVAPMVASSRDDVAFVIMLAGPGVDIVDLYVEQRSLIFKHSGVPNLQLEKIRQLDHMIFEQINKLSEGEEVSEKTRDMLSQISKVIGMTDEKAIKSQVDGLINAYTTPWFRYFLKFDPTPYLKKTKSPILAINGSLDVQVASTQNLSGIKSVLKAAKHPDYQVVELKNLNHLFQTAKTGNITEYDKIEETIAPVVLETMNKWLSKRFFK